MPELTYAELRDLHLETLQTDHDLSAAAIGAVGHVVSILVKFRIGQLYADFALHDRLRKHPQLGDCFSTSEPTSNPINCSTSEGTLAQCPAAAPPQPAKTEEAGTEASPNPPSAHTLTDWSTAAPEELWPLLKRLENSTTTWRALTRSQQIEAAAATLRLIRLEHPQLPLDKTAFNQHKPGWMPTLHGLLVGMQISQADLFQHAGVSLPARTRRAANKDAPQPDREAGSRQPQRQRPQRLPNAARLGSGLPGAPQPGSS